MTRWRPAVNAVLAAGAGLMFSCASHEAPKQVDRYADQQACAACHPKIAQTYKQTGMGRSFRKATAGDAVGAAFSHEVSGRSYKLEGREGRLYLQRSEPGKLSEAVEKEVHYVLGSGNHARSFLHKTPQNRLMEMPVNAYAERGGALAMSPGYDRPDHFDMRRAIGYQCMFCHNGYPKVSDGAVTADPVFDGAIPEGIDCQRCHGPGQAHVEAAGRAGAKPEVIRAAILNPKALTSERQMEVCAQCHLETTSFPLPNALVRMERDVFSYDPREPLADYIIHFDHAPGSGHEDKFEIASSVYRLRQAKCFRESGGKLTCTTCHNPHEAKKNFDAACAQCHGGIQAKAGHPAKKDCAGCHMPKRRTEDVIHVAVTDHRIQRPVAGAKWLSARGEAHQQMGSTSYQGEVVLYEPKTLTGAAGDLYPAIAQVAHQSNLKIGLTRLIAAIDRHKPTHPAYYLHAAQALQSAGRAEDALGYYRKALDRDGRFLPALRNLGAAQARAGQVAEARRNLEQATKEFPSDSLSWFELARLNRREGKLPEAAAAARKAIENEPELVDAHTALGSILLEMSDPAGAEKAFRAALREHPEEAEANAGLGGLLGARGEIVEATRCFERAVRSNPSNIAARFNYAVFLANQRKFSEAIVHGRAAVQLDPGNLNARDLLGNLYAATRDWRAAAEQYREAIRLDPEFGRGQLGLGTALGALNDLAGARLYLGKAAQSTDQGVRAEASELLRSIP